MDEFLQGINASIYLKWILMQNNHYSLNIKVDDNDNNTIIISNEIVIASKMQELAKLENLSYEIFATGYSRLFEIANDYDIILIAPQVAYMLPQAKRRLPDKEVVTIPTRIFATNDYSGALKIIYDWYQNKEEK